MKKRTSILSALLCLAMVFSLLAGCQPKEGQPDGSKSNPPAVSGSQSQPDNQGKTLRFAALSGPTGMGAAWLMKNGAEELGLGDGFHTEIMADNAAIKDALISGSVDVASVATNLAATLSAKTEGSIQVLAVNTLGVLQILEKGDSVHSIADLKGKTLYAFGQGANPEYVLNYLLTKNGVNPADVDIQWMPAQEVTAKMTSSESAICMLPVPAATALTMKDQGVRLAVSVNDAWEELGETSLPQGCIVVRTDFAKENPELVEAFLTKYEESIQFMSDEANHEEAAKLVAELAIAPNDKVAAQALPHSALTFVKGGEMKEMLENYFAILFEADPASIGGAMPYDSFYYGVG